MFGFREPLCQPLRVQSRVQFGVCLAFWLWLCLPLLGVSTYEVQKSFCQTHNFLNLEKKLWVTRKFCKKPVWPGLVKLCSGLFVLVSFFAFHVFKSFRFVLLAMKLGCGQQQSRRFTLRSHTLLNRKRKFQTKKPAYRKNKHIACNSGKAVPEIHSRCRHVYR